MGQGRIRECQTLVNEHKNFIFDTEYAYTGRAGHCNTPRREAVADMHPDLFCKLPDLRPSVNSKRSKVTI